MTIKLSDDHGLICGFILSSQRGMESLEWEAATLAVTAKPIAALNQTDGSPVWLHFNLNDSRARHWIESCDRLVISSPELFYKIILNSVPSAFSITRLV